MWRAGFILHISPINGSSFSLFYYRYLYYIVAMRFTSLNIPEEFTNKYALAPISMKGLGQVVLLAGKNGSGKTRFFRTLQELINTYPDTATERLVHENITRFGRSLKNYEDQLQNAEEGVDKTDISKDIQKLNEIERLKNSIIQNNRELGDQERALRIKNAIIIEPEKLNDSLVSFVPKILDLIDSYTMNPAEAEQNSKLIDAKEMDGLARGVIPAIHLIQKKFVNVSTTDTSDLDITEEEVEKIRSDYKRLKKYIALFLNTELKRDPAGNPVLFGRRIGDAQLSDGQKILLQFCMALYARETNLDNLVILMDEPENHLHPAALLEVLDIILKNIPNGQLWIATHSINVLAHFDPQCLQYINAGSISYEGNIPTNVLKGLLGEEEEIIRLQQFISLPDVHMLQKYAYQCLVIPNVVFNGSEDPQNKQTRDNLRFLRQGSRKISVLDIGVGKGRLLAAIDELDRKATVNTADWLDYDGFDITDVNKDLLHAIFKNVYNNDRNRFFTDLAEVQGKRYDVIILCNVFHELEPKVWYEYLVDLNGLRSLMSEEGHLIIVEDQFIPIGEKANSFGFLLMGSAQLRIMFGVAADDKDFEEGDYRKDGRLKSYRIPKRYLFNVTKQSIRDALISLHEDSLIQIEEVRKMEVNYKTARMHAMWTQLYANSQLALRVWNQNLS